MATYISILRGINVNGQKTLKMDALRKLYEDFGFQNVITYLQSGNIIFKGDDFEVNSLKQSISKQIERIYGFEVSIIIFTVDKLNEIIENNPFKKNLTKEPSYLHVTFLSSNPEHYDKRAIEVKKQGQEEISFSENAIYLYCPNGYGKTKLSNNFLEAKLNVIATTRNWKTTNELFKIAQQIM